MILMAGIGNTGKEYDNTRHNIGFRFIDMLANQIGDGKFNKSNKFLSEICKTTYQNQKIYLMKPRTFVNLSGNAIQKWKTFYKAENKDIFVFYDDITVPLGKIRISNQHSVGSHNGIKSITASIGQDYNRVKFGLKPIQRQDQKHNIISKEFVLGKLNQQENEILDKQMKYIINQIHLLINRDDNSKSILIEKVTQKTDQDDNKN